MMHAADRINARVLCANLFLLFWLSIVPFVIRWIDEAGLKPLPTAVQPSGTGAKTENIGRTPAWICGTGAV